MRVSRSPFAVARECDDINEYLFNLPVKLENTEKHLYMFYAQFCLRYLAFAQKVLYLLCRGI